MTESSSATYVYCTVHSAGRLSGARAPGGIPGAASPRPVWLAGSLWMVVADAPSSLYGESALRDNLRSLEWVSDVAVAHEAVVEHFARMRGRTVIPMKLLTLFSSEEKARAELGRRRREIAATMRRIAGCEEWGVRIFAAATDAAPAESRTRASRSESLSGTAFLAARKAAREAGKAIRGRTLEAAEAAYEELARVARAASQRSRTAEPGGNPPLLDAAFLVRAASRSQFKATSKKQAKACAAAGARMTLSGPWPAYNFVGDTGEKK